MQLSAKDRTGTIVFAAEALKSCDYFCRECNGTMRVRRGAERRDHFFHLNAVPSCRQSGKSMEHLQVQRHIQSALPNGAIVLERRFPEVGRIADAVWEEERLVFEVQCSPITVEEVEARNRDYQALGYRVVWILHERHYYRPVISEVEQLLWRLPHYFTDIDSEGDGIIYDQVSRSSVKRTREVKGKKLRIEVSQPRYMAGGQLALIACLQRQNEEGHVYFAGDVIDCSLGDRFFFRQAAAFCKPRSALPRIFLQFGSALWQRGVVRPYFILFQHFLEKTSR